MVIGRPKALTVGGIEIIGLLHFLPAGEILDGTRGAAVAVEINVEQYRLAAETLDVKGNVIVHLVYCQSHIERLLLHIVNNHADIGILFLLLYRQQQVVAVYFYVLHGMIVA